MSNPHFDGLQLQNFNCAQFPSLSLRPFPSLSLKHFFLSLTQHFLFFFHFSPSILLASLPLPPALCVNFRIFQRVGLSWHEMGLAKETIFTTESLPLRSSLLSKPTFPPEKLVHVQFHCFLLSLFFIPQTTMLYLTVMTGCLHVSFYSEHEKHRFDH